MDNIKIIKNKVMEYMNKKEVKFIEVIFWPIRDKEKVFYNFKIGVKYMDYG